MNELRQVLRALWKSPGYVLVATLLLGLGLGVNATMFSLANTMLFKPLGGVKDAGSLVLLGQTKGRSGFMPFSYPHFEDYRKSSRTLQSLAAFQPTRASIVHQDHAVVVPAEMVSGNYFSLLGTTAAAGRLFGERDDAAGTEELTVVISERLWDRLWQRSAAAIGSRVMVNSQPFTVIGVVGEGFRGAVLPSEVELWIPFAAEPVFRPQAGMLSNRNFMWVRAIGRLHEGVTETAAQSELSAIAARLAMEYPDAGDGVGIRVWGYHPFPSPSGFRGAMQFLGLLSAVSVLVLVVVCANLSNLMLARAIARQREMAIRSALGASRIRLLWLMLLEGSVLATLGLTASLMFSSWVATALVNLIPGENNAPINLVIEQDVVVALAAAALALVCTLAFGALPAWLASSVDLVPSLRAGDSNSSPRGSRLRSLSLAVQIALCCLLLVGAGLLYRSMQSLRAVDTGLNAERLLLANLDLGLAGYERDRAVLFQRELLEHLRSLPGTESAAIGFTVPLGEGAFQLGPVFGGKVAASEALHVDSNPVSTGYFRTMGIPLRAGREFLDSETVNSRPVVIVNETLARSLWPDGNALGQTLMHYRPEAPLAYEVVGIVKDVRYRGLQDSARPFLYWSIAQHPELALTIHVRTHSEPMTAVEAVRKTVASMDAALALGHIETMEQRVDNSLWMSRVTGMMVSACGLLGMLIASLGLYGVVSYDVSRKTREIGVRMALGASISGVVRAVIAHTARVAVLGIVCGLGLAGILGRFLGSLLYGVSPWDLLTFAGTGFLLLTVLLVASALPAWRATRIQPVRALRLE